jgi:Peptidogalycan biosysnthesis/recognition
MRITTHALGDWITNAGASYEISDPPIDAGIIITRSQEVKPSDMCYLTSLRSHFFDYPAQELGLRTWRGRFLQWGGKVAWCCGFDRLSLIGNAPISTNLRSDIQKSLIPQIAKKELQKNPDYWVGVRNILPTDDSGLVDALSEQDFVFLPTRVVYCFDARSGVLPRSSHLQRDRKNLSKSHLEIKIDEPVTPDDLTTIHRLYHEIYIEKHSKLNARYSLKFFQDMIDLVQMPCLRVYDHSILVAFALLYRKGDRLVVPAVGHASDENNKGYYRSLFAAIAQYIEAHALYLNYSSGAGDFKRKRGGVPLLEYTAIHAPANSKLKQSLIRFVAQKARSVTMEMMIESGA